VAPAPTQEAQTPAAAPPIPEPTPPARTARNKHTQQAEMTPPPRRLIKPTAEEIAAQKRLIDEMEHETDQLD